MILCEEENYIQFKDRKIHIGYNFHSLENAELVSLMLFHQTPFFNHLCALWKTLYKQDSFSKYQRKLDAFPVGDITQYFFSKASYGQVDIKVHLFILYPYIHRMTRIEEVLKNQWFVSCNITCLGIWVHWDHYLEFLFNFSAHSEFPRYRMCVCASVKSFYLRIWKC